MFKKIETDEALIVERGVYKMAEVYEGPDGGLYIKAKGGFVRVKEKGDTSHSAVAVQTLAREGPLFRDTWGRLCVTAEGPEARKPVALSNDGGRLALPKA